MEKNATSLARRFRNLAGLKLLLSDELAALEAAKQKAVSALEELSEACTYRPQTLVEQACPTHPITRPRPIVRIKSPLY